MSNDYQKADQIAHRLYTKLTLVVNHARATPEPPPQSKVDKWFNLETPEADIFKEHTRIYRSISSSMSPPSFQLQVLLCVPDLTNNQILAYLAPDSSRFPVDPAPQFILLESWSISFAAHPAHQRFADDRADVAPPTIYKHGISLFRSVYTLLHILPSWKLVRRYRRRHPNGTFSISLRVENPDESTRLQGVLGFDTPVQNGLSLPKDVHEFPAIYHPTGSLSFSVTYLKSPNFEVVERESLLSSRFLSQDEGPEFTPTLLRNQQRASLSASPGSLPTRTSLPRSPPSSVADRFVVPPTLHRRTPSQQGGSPRAQPIGLPIMRTTSTHGGTAGSTSGDGSFSRHTPASSVSREESMPVSALAARIRRESFGMSRGADQSSVSSPGPLPIRRPQLNPVNPFKSSTLSSGSPSLHSPSPSLRHSPLSSGGGPSLPSRPTLASPTSSRAPAPPSPIGIGSRLPSSPSMPVRPSPPFAPSSLGDRRSLGSAEGGDGSPRPPSTKRYSSSFGHRYAATGGAGSEGSAGSGVREGERVASASFLSTNTDDDDISAFVQDIDARKPLSSLREQASQEASDRYDAPPDFRRATPGSLSRARTLSVPEPMLTTASAVDERLQQMKDTFMASLQGFGNSRRRAPSERDNASGSSGSATARAPSSGPSTIGRRTVDPINIGSGRGRGHERQTSAGGMDLGLPAGYVRPRFASTGSTRSGMSVASEEVLGRMDRD